MTLSVDPSGFYFDQEHMTCALGRSGLVSQDQKTEGDGATPTGCWPLRRVYWRPDRLEKPETTLPVSAIQTDDGWCDDPTDPAYNRLVRLPYPASCETLTREDELYDIIVVLGHNDNPPVPGKGSAIFLHCAKPGYPPTQGCVALDRADLLRVLARVRPGDTLTITEETR